MRPARPIPERMDAVTVVDESTGCWLWTGTMNSYGYGILIAGSGSKGTSKTLMAHRLSYERHVGPIPAGLDLDHLCRVRNCINPAHLEPVTRRENLLRGQTLPAANVAKTHCPQGHPYAGDNLGHWRGTRVCRTCKRIAQQLIRDRRKEESCSA